MKETKLIIEPTCSSIIDSFAREISENSEVHTIIGTEENLNNILEQDKFCDSYTNNRTIALGDSEKFNTSASGITDINLTTSEIICLREKAGIYTFQEASKLFYDNVSQTIDYKSFKNKKTRDAVEKIKKIIKFCPGILNVFQSKKQN
ncbi:hypothetical protein IIA95_00915 [Patescibacteria group bacterium]|nr:hypothetical protein [Patescibacteria group bacterium]